MNHKITMKERTNTPPHEHLPPSPLSSSHTHSARFFLLEDFLFYFPPQPTLLVGIGMRRWILPAHYEIELGAFIIPLCFSEGSIYS